MPRTGSWHAGSLGIPVSLRLSQVLLVAAAAFLLALILFNNLSDYGSNWQFVRHVLAMDTTFPGNSGMWRATQSEAVARVFYWTIIGWEALTCALLWAGAARLWRARREGAPAWQAAKALATAGLTLSLMQWSVFFLAVGAEWFLMWQSKTWNGQDAATRMFLVMGLTLVVLHADDRRQPA